MKPSQLLSYLRPSCRVLMTPNAVVLQTARGAQALVCPVRRAPGLPAPQPPQLAQAVALLLQMLATARVQGRRVHLLVSDFWARPAVLVMPAKTRSDAETDALLAKHFGAMYGDPVQDWRICWSATTRHLTSLAWPNAALTALNAGLAARNCVLASAKPMGLVVAKHLPHDPSPHWLLILTRSCASLLRWQQGELIDWCVLPDVSGSTDWTCDLPLLLAREAARRGDTCRALRMVDFAATANTANTANTSRLRQTLQDAGWSPKMVSAELCAHWLARLEAAALTPSKI